LLACHYPSHYLMALGFSVPYRKSMKRDPALFDVDMLLLHLLLVPFFLIFSRLYVFLNTLTPLFLLTILVALCAAVLILMQGAYRALLIAPLVVLGFTLAMLRFSEVSGTEFNPRALSQFVGLFAIFVTYRFTSQGKTPQLVKVIFWYAIGYAFIYLLLNAALKFGIYHPRGTHQAIVLKDFSRRPRLLLANGIVSFGVAMIMARLRHHLNMKNMLIAGLFALTIFASLSRTYTAVVLLVGLCYFITRNARVPGWICFAILVSISFVLIAGLYFPTYNPFIHPGDASSYVRAEEYEIARQYILRWPILGIGFPSLGPRGYKEFLAVDVFAASDLGAVGIWMTFGLAGLVMFLVSALICTFSYRERYDQVTRDTLALTGAMMTGYAVIAPSMWYNEATLFLALLIGERLYALNIGGAKSRSARKAASATSRRRPTKIDYTPEPSSSNPS